MTGSAEVVGESQEAAQGLGEDGGGVSPVPQLHSRA